MAIDNGSFETPDASGDFAADGWALTVVATAEEFAEFRRDPGDPNTTGQDTFDVGWYLPLAQTIKLNFDGGFFVDLFPAFFGVAGSAVVDTFETEWPTVVPLFELSGIDLAQFDVDPEPVEDVEEDWNAPGDELIPGFAPADLAFAAFDATTPEGFEDFEEEWDGNENYILAFQPADTMSAQFTEGGGTMQIERMGDGGIRFPIAGVIVDPALDTFDVGGAPYGALELVTFTSTGQLPGGVQPDTFYFVRNVASPVFEISGQAAGPILDVLDVGTGQLSVKGDPATYWTAEVTGV